MEPQYTSEFLRGAIWQWGGWLKLAELNDMLDEAEKREAGKPTAADVVNELKEALEEIDNYRGGADSVLEDKYVTERRHDALALAYAFQGKCSEVIPGTHAALAALTIRPTSEVREAAAPTAAEVIAAAKEILVEDLWNVEDAHSSKVVRKALGLIAAWEAAQHE